MGAFFLSGACGLVYQVLWVRQLSLIFGTTSFAMATVLASFMGGLALGSALAGRLADRLTSPLRAYGLLELAIALAALAIPFGLDAAAALHGRFVPLESPLPCSLGVQLLLCGALLLLPTTCMGATLPILSRYVVRQPSSRGQDLGLLYALNTLGAFSGTLLAGFLALELLGISSTNALAAALNIAVGLTALWLARRASSASHDEQEAEPSSEDDEEGWSMRTVLCLAACAGFTGLAYEVIWTRLIGLLLLTTTYAYTTILATVIGGIGLGSLAGARLADRVRSPVRWFGFLQLGIALSAFAIFPLLSLAVDQLPWILDASTLPFGQGQLLAVTVCAAVTALPSLLMGATYPALARAITRGTRRLGQRIARLYALNTLGAILGSLAAGFLLLPQLGVLGSLRTLALANLALGLVAAWPRRATAPAWRRAFATLLAATLLVGALGGSRFDLERLYQARLPPGSEILHLSEGITSTVMVADHSQPAVRRIWIQSCWVAGTGGTHKMLGHLSMLHAGQPRSVAGIAFGTGQSFGTTLLYPVRELACIDLNREMVEAGGHWFSAHNHQLLQQEQVQVHIRDGRDFLARTQQRFDAVLVEPLQPWSAGAVNLYTREFYQLGQQTLGQQGVLTQWLPLDDVPPELTRSVICTMADVFPETYAYLDNYDLWLVGTVAERPPPLERWRARIATPAIQQDLAAIDYPELGSILATLLLGPADLPAFCQGAVPLLDDRPFMEFQAPRSIHGYHLAANIEAMARDCQAPLARFAQADLAQLPAGLQDGSVARDLARCIVADDKDQLEEAHEHCQRAWRAAPGIARCRLGYWGATQRWAAALESVGDVRAAERLYLVHLDEDPGFDGGWLNLGLLLARDQRYEAAREVLERVTRSPAVGSQATQALELLPARVEE